MAVWLYFAARSWFFIRITENKYEGWVLPKGTVEAGEEFKETALREVKEETGVQAQIIKYIGKSQYSFKHAAGYGGKGSPLVFNDGGQLLQ